MKNRNKGKIHLLYEAFSGYKMRIGLLSILGIIGGIFEGIGINTLVPLISFVTGEENTATDFITENIEKAFLFFNIGFSLKSLLILIFILFFAKAVVKVIFNYIKIKISTEYEQNVGGNLLAKTIKANWQCLSGQKIGHLQNTIMTDVHFGALTLEFIGTIIMILSSLFVYFFIAINISAKITVLALSFGAILFLATRPLMEISRKLSFQTAILNKKVSHYINENILGIKTIKALSVGETVLEKGVSYFKELRRLRIKTNILRGNTQAFIEPAGLLFIIIIFAFLYKGGSFSLPSFVVIIYLVERIFTYTNQLQTTVHKLYGSLPYLEHVISYEKENEAKEEKDEGMEKFSFAQNVSLENVSFSYIENRPVLNSIDLSLKKGEMIGIIGPSGVGKTTFVDLILRLLRPTKGNILLDDINIEKFSLKEWRKNVGYISQEPFLINGTVLENIKFFDETITDEDAYDAAEKAYIKDVIEKLPKKFETMVGERGVELSAGQRQRIAIARVLARKPKILILDEATSALDNESELYIQKALDELRGEVTIFAIAHRLSTIMNCNKIISFYDGEILEEGSPKELMDDKKSYLYKMLHIKNE
jgi:ABC-type multidrug transport system fused ATPase/permease subunit